MGRRALRLVDPQPLPRPLNCGGGFLGTASEDAMLTKMKIDMSREWLIMLQDYCVKAEAGQDIPPACVQAMGEFLSELSSELKKAEADKKRSTGARAA